MRNEGRLQPIKFCFNNTTLSDPWFIERHLIARMDTSMAASSANPTQSEYN